MRGGGRTEYRGRQNCSGEVGRVKVQLKSIEISTRALFHSLHWVMLSLSLVSTTLPLPPPPLPPSPPNEPEITDGAFVIIASRNDADDNTTRTWNRTTTAPTRLRTYTPIHPHPLPKAKTHPKKTIQLIPCKR